MTHQITISDQLWGQIQGVSVSLNLPPEELITRAVDHYIHHEKIPNAETRRVLEDADRGIGLTPPMTLAAFSSWLDTLADDDTDDETA
jgi:predicted transcriptional regulator